MKYYITACGCINPYGRTPLEFVHNYPYSSHIDCTQDFRLYDTEILRRHLRIDISCQFLLEAVHQVADNAITHLYKRIGIIVGASCGPLDLQSRFYNSHKKGQRGSPVLFKMATNNIYSGLIALHYGIHDYNVTLYTGSTASIDAVNLSIDLLESKTVDAVICAAVESGTRDVYKGAAAVLIAPVCQHFSNLEVIRGNQLHLFTNSEILYNLGPYVTDTSYDAFFCDATAKFTLQNIIPKIRDKVICLEQFSSHFGATAGLLQIIFSLYSQQRSLLIINKQRDQFSYLMLRREFL